MKFILFTFVGISSTFASANPNIFTHSNVAVYCENPLVIQQINEALKTAEGVLAGYNQLTSNADGTFLLRDNDIVIERNNFSGTNSELLMARKHQDGPDLVATASVEGQKGSNFTIQFSTGRYRTHVKTGTMTSRITYANLSSIRIFESACTLTVRQ